MNIEYKAEYTDTFGGDANYSWVRRASFEAAAAATNVQLLNAAKKALGIDGSFRLDYDGELIRYNELAGWRCLFINAEY